MGCCERVGSARNLCPRWIAAKASSVSSCTADVGLDPSGECLLTPQTAPAVGQTTGKRFALPNVYTRSLLRPTPSTGAGPGSARERNTHPIGCPSLGGSDASAGVSRNAALGFHAGVVGSGASRSLVQTRRGPTSANRGPPWPGRAGRAQAGRSWRHQRRCLRQSKAAAIGIRSARRMASRPRCVGGRKSNASWISGAKQ